MASSGANVEDSAGIAAKQQLECSNMGRGDIVNGLETFDATQMQHGGRNAMDINGL